MSLKITVDKTAQMLRSIQAMAGKHVVIGIPSENAERRDSKFTNAQIGYVHEFGSPAKNIPARPFLIPGVEQASEKAANVLGKFAKQGFDDETAIDRGLNAAGIISVSAVKQRITSGEGFAPLSESTLRERDRAGFNGTKPLIRSGQLRNSITYAVRTKKG